MFIEGKIIDAKTKEPMFGVNVFISDSSGKIGNPPVGSPTDPDGEYFFQGGKVGDYISASYVGYKTKTKKISSSSPINWELEPTAEALPEFQVIEYKDDPPQQPIGNMARKDKKRNYTPYIIGGIALVVLIVGGIITYKVTKKK
jgi:hypothetical protein